MITRYTLASRAKALRRRARDNNCLVIDDFGSEPASQPRDMGLERPASGLRGLFSPHGVDEVVRGDGPVQVEQQVREHSPLLGASDGDRAVAIRGSEGAQELVAHRGTVLLPSLTGNPLRRRPRGGHGRGSWNAVLASSLQSSGRAIRLQGLRADARWAREHCI
jgi:hypothetical protein